MKSDNFLLVVAVVAVVVSIVGISVTYDSITSFQNMLTGFAVETGFVNVTLTSSATMLFLLLTLHLELLFLKDHL